jgi:hypothetical protein
MVEVEHLDVGGFTPSEPVVVEALSYARETHVINDGYALRGV